jgi:hypothetical protein
VERKDERKKCKEYKSSKIFRSSTVRTYDEFEIFCSGRRQIGRKRPVSLRGARTEIILYVTANYKV